MCTSFAFFNLTNVRRNNVIMASMWCSSTPLAANYIFVSIFVFESTLHCAYLYIKVYAVWNKIEVDTDTTKAATSSHHYGPSTESVSANPTGTTFIETLPPNNH